MSNKMDEATKVLARAFAYEQAQRLTERWASIEGAQLDLDQPVTEFIQPIVWTRELGLSQGTPLQWMKRGWLVGKLIGKTAKMTPEELDAYKGRKVRKYALTLRGAMELPHYLESPTFAQYQAKGYAARDVLAARREARKLEAAKSNVVPIKAEAEVKAEPATETSSDRIDRIEESLSTLTELLNMMMIEKKENQG